MAKFTEADMRARFHEATAEAAAIRAEAAPHRAASDEIERKIQALCVEQEPHVARFNEIEKDLFDLDNERGLLARALNGQTGTPPQG